MDNNESSDIVTEGDKPKFTGRGSYLKNNPDAARKNGAKGDSSKKTGRKRSKVPLVVDKETLKFMEGIDWKQKDKIEENTLELLGGLLKVAKGDFDRMLNVAKEIIKLVPKKETDQGPRLIQMNFLGNMQTQPDPLDAIEVADYKVLEDKSGMSKEGINDLLNAAEKAIEETMGNATS